MVPLDYHIVRGSLLKIWNSTVIRILSTLATITRGEPRFHRSYKGVHGGAVRSVPEDAHRYPMGTLDQLVEH